MLAIHLTTFIGKLLQVQESSCGLQIMSFNCLIQTAPGHTHLRSTF